MSDVQSRAKVYKDKVLRLKKLLDTLRGIAQSYLPVNPTVGEVATTLGIEWTTAHRFWKDKRPGGPKVVQAIRAKSGEHHQLCDEILSLVGTIPDTYKSLVGYPVAAIQLVFDIGDAFSYAGQQAGIIERDQMTGAQFSTLFGQHKSFVLGITMRSREILGFYSAELDSQIRSVLDSTDWSTVRPLKQSSPPAPTGKAAQLQELIRQIRPHYASQWAMIEALSTHQDSFKNALAGKGLPRVLDELLRKAQRLAVKMQTPTVVAPQPEKEPVDVKDAQSFVGSFISSLNSFVRMAEAAGVDQKSFTDGHRDSIIRVMFKLAALAGIDGAAIKRLQSVEGLAAGDPSLNKVFSALRGAKQ